MFRLIVIAMPILLGGCASTIEAWKGRSWGSHVFRPDKIYVASADRRIVLTGSKDGQTVACPELSPEVAVSRGATSAPAISLAQAQSLTLADAISVSQMKGHELDPSSQKYAMLHWSLCTAYLNGTIDRETYKTELLALVKAGTNAMTAQATSAAPPKAPAK